MKHLLASLALLALASAHAAEKPNILFAIADDWGVHAGAYGTPWVKTPAFDRLAREGLLFRNAFTPTAKCAPSRASVLTGRYPWQNEEAGNHLAVFPPKLKSWPEVLMEKGWHTGLTGKGWGPGIANDTNGRPRLITGQHFDRHKAAPPASGMSNHDYAANFKEFLDAAPQFRPAGASLVEVGGAGGGRPTKRRGGEDRFLGFGGRIHGCRVGHTAVTCAGPRQKGSLN